jgi:hypothetical protein
MKHAREVSTAGAASVLRILRLDVSTMREVLSREDLPEPETSVQCRGLAVGETTVGLLAACARLIELPEDIPFLSHLIQREIVYRILRTPQGERLRAIATTGEPQSQNGKSHRLAEGQPCQAVAHGGTRSGCADGSVDAPPPVPCIDGIEPAPIPEAAPATDSTAAHAHRRD